MPRPTPPVSEIVPWIQTWAVCTHSEVQVQGRLDQRSGFLPRISIYPRTLEIWDALQRPGQYWPFPPEV